MVVRRPLMGLAAAAPVLLAAVLTHEIYRRPGSAYVDFERRYEGGFISGFHGHEEMDGRGFRWSTGDSRIHLDHLPRQSRLRIEVRLKALRPKEAPTPRVRFTANGATVFETVCAPGLVTYRFGVSLLEEELVLGIHPDIFVPAHYGRDDDRVLGVQVFSVHVEPLGGEPTSGRPLLWMMGTAIALMAMGLVAGLSLPLSSVVASGLVAFFGELLSHDSVRFLDYPRQTFLLAGAGLAAAIVMKLLLRRAGWLTARARAVLIGVLAAGVVWKLTGLFYPLFFSSDVDFHLNRMLEVMEGDILTTSVSQHSPPFRIPYPVSLYVVALPLTPLTTTGADLVDLLQAVTAVADVAVGLVLAFFAARYLRDVTAGVLAAAAYQLVPLNFLAFSSGNLTNLFGVATTVFVLGLLLAASSRRGPPWVLGVGVMSIIALTSHFGTFLFGLVAWPMWLAALGWSAPASAEPPPIRRLVIAVALSLVVVAVYYAGYWPLFSTQWDRVLARDYATGDAAVGGPLDKLSFNLTFYRQQLGIGFALLALLGGVAVLRRPRATPFHAAATGWIGAAGVFLALDLTTALEVRYMLQILPLLALFAAIPIASLLRRGWLGRVAGVAGLAYLAAIGLWSFRYCLLERYH